MPADSPPPSSPGTPFLGADAGRVYLGCTGVEYTVCGYDIATGKRLWSNDNGDAGVGAGGEANGVLYLNDGTVLNAATGKLLRSLTTGTVALVGTAGSVS